MPVVLLVISVNAKILFQSLIDLAGSERATSDKDRTREGRYINTRHVIAHRMYTIRPNIPR